MKKWVVFVSMLVTSCASYTPGLQVPEFSGPYYLLSNDHLGELESVITLNPDGSILYDLSRSKRSLLSANGDYYTKWTVVDSKIIILSGKHSEFIREKYQIIKGSYFTAIYLNQKNDKTNIYTPYQDLVQNIRISTYGENATHTISTSTIVRGDNNFEALKSSISLKSQAAQNNWNTLDKQSVKALVKFIGETADEALREEANSALKSLVDEKIKLYVKKSFAHVMSYYDFPVVLQGGQEVCSFSDLIRFPISSINPNTGEKWLCIIRKNKYPQGFDLTLGEEGKEATLSFKIHNGKIVAMGIKKGLLDNPQGWEFAIYGIARQTVNYPEMESIDTEYLDKIK